MCLAKSKAAGRVRVGAEYGGAVLLASVYESVVGPFLLVQTSMPERVSSMTSRIGMQTSWMTLTPHS